ncbi:MAG TPA: HAMP domain-containing sensor histidine kinase [Acidimicrobiia bacterium]|nr:HAMP domain-containing sensor histidine kinase [Acidimicrobiia bacterium]
MVRAAVVVFVLCGGTLLVYATGGTGFVWPHIMYVAVVLAGMSFGRRMGALTGIVAGLLMGPIMPMDVATGTPQSPEGWLVRMGFYVAIGVLAGYARYRFYRLLSRRSTFLSALSHELRTPLAAIVGFAQILDGQWDQLPEEEKREVTAHIVHESVEVAHVVEDLMVAARLDGGTLQINHDVLDVREIADAICESLAQKYPGAIAVNGKGRGWGDPVRVRHMLRNVIECVLAHGGGPASVEISGDDQSVRIVVTDENGSDPALTPPRLLEPLLVEEVHIKHQTIGLGLAVARELARRMEGRLTYQRENGHGFYTLELPAGLAAHSSPADVVG